MAEQFLLSLQGRRVCKDQKDKVIWSGSKDGKFPIKVLYSTLETESTLLFPACVIWNSWVLSKVSFFAW